MKKNFSVVNCEGFANCFEGIPEVVDFSDDSFGRVGHIVEVFSGVEFHNVDNKQVTASSLRTQGLEVFKVCLCLISLSDQPSPDAYRSMLVIGAY